MNKLGEKLSPVLVEIEDALWESESERSGQPNFTDDGFRAIVKIMMAALMDKMWNLQRNERISQHDREVMAQKAGGDFRNFIKTYTDIDTFELYKPTPNEAHPL